MLCFLKFYFFAIYVHCYFRKIAKDKNKINKNMAEVSFFRHTSLRTSKPLPLSFLY